jgi:hypothetical protein
MPPPSTRLPPPGDPWAPADDPAGPASAAWSDGFLDAAGAP